MMGSHRAMRTVRIAALITLGAVAAAMADEPEYRLAEGDQLRLVVPGAPQFAGLYRLGESGRIGLPLDGQVELGGMTLEEASVAIRDALTREVQQPALGVEIAERRPFFIMGDVADSGSYPAEPGLTLGKAMALAGGARRTFSDELQATVVAVRSDEEFGGSLFDLAAARIRAARLEAALEGNKEFVAPPPPPRLEPTEVAAVETRERAILEASTDAYESRMVLLRRLLQTRLDEIAALEARLDTIAEHSRRLDVDIAEVEDLRARGLSTMDRLQSLTREKDRTQSDLLQTNVMLNQAREEQVQIEIDLDETPRVRRIDLLNDLADTQDRMRRLEGSIAASAQLIDASAGSTAVRDVVQVTFTITRADGRQESIADPNAPVRPGDLIEVKRTVAFELLGQ